MIDSGEEGRFELELTVNGRTVRRSVPTTLRLLDFLREELRLTSVKEVCGEGECGACTVLLDGLTVNSCLVLAVEAHGADIVTVEGLEAAGEHTPLMEAFLEQHAVQCGYCIPGMVLSGVQALADHDHPTPEQVAEGLAGNICRCTGYHKIIRAVVDAGGGRP